jgi:hypothetical protein
MYRSIYLWLNEAARLIARDLASAHPAEYPDEATALDNARRQLVRALFDGAVDSEGVPLQGDPGPEDAYEPPTPPDPLKWKQIEAGWWSHERYEQYVVRDQQTELELFSLRSEAFKDKEAPKPEFVETVVDGAYLLDQIIVFWNDDAFEIKGFDDHGYARIRVLSADIQTHFAIEAAELKRAEHGQPVEAAATSGIGQPTETGEAKRRRTKPDPVRTAVDDWLDTCRRERGPDWIRPKSNPWLAKQYFISLASPIGDPDYVRKLIAAWRKEHGLARVSKLKV